MLNSVYGKLEYVMSNRAIVSTGLGLEFDIIVSSSTASALLNKEKGSDVRLLVVLQHREDSLLLYGFRTEEERSLFNELMGVNGIGAKQALKILSSLSVSEFFTCLNDMNIKSLASIPGLGLKTAQKIVLALKDKLVPIEKKESGKKSAREKEIFSSIQDSLQDMGFDKQRVKAAVEKSAGLVDKSSFGDNNALEEEVFKSAFQILSKEK